VHIISNLHTTTTNTLTLLWVWKFPSR